MFRLPRLSEAERRDLGSALALQARFSNSFVILTLGSSAIATLGLLENSAAVIIGAMIIAPLLAPIQALAYGVLDGSLEHIRASCISLVAGSVLAVGVSTLLARGLGLTILGTEVTSRTHPNLLDLGIAIAAGLVGGFARTRPGISNTIAGTAIAVALMPPLCVIGIGVASEDFGLQAARFSFSLRTYSALHSRAWSSSFSRDTLRGMSDARCCGRSASPSRSSFR